MINKIQNKLRNLTDLQIILIFIITGIIVYSNTFFNKFAADDIAIIIDNPKLHSIIYIGDYFRGGLYYAGENNPLLGTFYRPIALTVISFVNTIFGVKSLPLHFLQLTLHIVNSLLVLSLFKKFFSRGISIVLALIFLVHPINSESVYYIAAYQEPLFFIFGMGALLLLINNKTDIKTKIFAPLLLLLSIFTKETGILFLIIIGVYIFLYSKNKIKTFIPFVFSIGIYAVLRLTAIGINYHDRTSPIAYLSLTERLLNIPSIANFYLIRLVYPKDLIMSYNQVIKDVNFGNFYLPLIISLLFITILICGLVYSFKKQLNLRKTYLFFLSWFFVGLSLHLQIIALDMTASERWLYFPIVGLLGILGFVLEISNKKYRNYISLLLLLFLITFLLLSIRTFVRGFDWRDNKTIAVHDLRISNDEYLLHGNLGYQMGLDGQLDEARKELGISVQLFPYAYNNYGNYCAINILMYRRDKSKADLLNAIKCYEDMTKIYTRDLLYINIINYSVAYGDYDKALEYTKKGQKLFPRSQVFRSAPALIEQVRDYE